MPLRLYNTLTRQLDPVAPADPASITFYTCGPTVYDDAHIGNFRSFLAADLLRRWLESPLCILENDPQGFSGPRAVRHIMNITDVGHMTDDDLADGGGEDKMQAAALRLLEQKKAGTAHTSDAADIENPSDPRQIADFYTRRFIDDARRLGLKVAHEAETDPSRMPRASHYVEHMKRMIEDLAGKGFAYKARDAVYFDVQKYESYGELSGNTLDKLKGGAGGRVDDAHQADKRHQADFLLWKSDPTHLMNWPGPVIGGVPMPEGYPGWHIECSAMARDLLGETIDLHSGGEDNIFPHHECERAQSCCATGDQAPSDTFARHWFHPRFLLVEGKKMSKSKGNFFTPRDLFAKGHDPAAVRLELIKTHYRSNANFTEQGLKDSARTIDRWRKFAQSSQPGNAHDDSVLGRFAEAMHDDLNIAAAIGHINTWIGAVEKPTAAHAEMLRALDAVLGLLDLTPLASAQTDIGVFAAGLEPDPTVIERLVARREAKKAKDFAAADAIRDELNAMGYAIKDIAGGRVEVSPA
ncbi:MAG: cysteine--tRNA ligase [Planctomycetota bacterium]